MPLTRGSFSSSLVLLGSSPSHLLACLASRDRRRALYIVTAIRARDDLL